MVALCSPSPALLSPLGARLGSRPSVAGAPPAGASGSRPPPVQARAACLVATCTSEPGAGHRSLGRLPSCQPAIMRFNAAMLMLSDLTGLSHNLYKPSTLGKNRHVTYGQHTPARHRAQRAARCIQHPWWALARAPAPYPCDPRLLRGRLLPRPPPPGKCLPCRRRCPPAEAVQTTQVP